MRKTVNADNFSFVKRIIDNGATVEEAARFSGLSPATVSRIKAADNVEEYTENMQAAARRSAAAREARKTRLQAAEAASAVVSVLPAVPAMQAAARPITSPVSTYQVNRLIELQTEQAELLKTISAKLAFIVDQLA